MRSSSAAWIVVLACALSAPAQKYAGGHLHSEAGYKMTPMPAPRLMEGIGTTSLRMTTKNAKAQAYFAQGVELLHCFWDFEAYRAFKEAAHIDPGAAMAYWGIAQSINDYPAMRDERDAALKKAKDLMGRASDREQYYVRAQQKRLMQNNEDEYYEELEALIARYPDDVDAKLFLAISLPAGWKPDGAPRKRELYAVLLARDVLAAHPDNAAANHYLIHLLEGGPHAADALSAANKLPKLGPASGHLVHMPGHIYYQLGDQERARAAFLDSMRVDEEYMRREHVPATDVFNYAHNLSYLIAGDAEAGRYQEALAMAVKLDALPANPFLTVGKPAYALTVGASTARLLIRFGKWREVIAHPVGIGPEDTAEPSARAFRDGVLAYARGMLALETRNVKGAAHEAEALEALLGRLKSGPAGKEKGNESQPDRVVALLETASLDLRGNIACEQGHADAGIALLKKAVEKEIRDVGYGEPPQYSRPESESLGYAYLRAGQYENARAAFHQELQRRPNSGHALYGIAQSYELAHDRKAAARSYREFLAAWKNADPDLPMQQHARTLLN